GNLIQVWSQRRVGGVLVRDSGLAAVVNHGNLILLGFEKWAPANIVPLDPALTAESAKGVVASHAAPFAFTERAAKPSKAHLELVPLARSGSDAYDFRLAWVVTGSLEGDMGTWEGLVDAQSGDLLSFVDLNSYASVKRVVGGVYPLSNDGQAP